MSSCRVHERSFPLKSSDFTRKYYLYEKKSDRRYYDEQIEVKGVLSQVTRDKNNNLVLILARRNEAYGVKCKFNKSASNLKQPLELQHFVTVKGTCKGLKEHILLVNCTFVEK